MLKCGWCKAETKPIYSLKDGKFLCPICAEKHYSSVYFKMKKHIQDVENGLDNKSRKLTKLKQAMCKHENQIDTGYCKFFSPKVTKEIYRCENCGKTIYKDKINFNNIK